MATPSAPIPSAPSQEPLPANPLDGRYSRQILFPGIAAAGQARLALSHAAIIGVGATGAATASLLARAGVGTLTLIDRDIVEPSNLQRQILFDEADAHEARPKALAAQRHIALFNSSITIHAHVQDLIPANIATLLPPEIDLFLDCTDNFETRYLLNDYAVQQNKPWIYAAAVGSYAATMTILPMPAKPWALSPKPSPPTPAPITTPPLPAGPWALNPGPSSAGPSPTGPSPTACLACLFPTPPNGPTETCDTAGILGPTVNLAASLQSTEALKLLSGQPHLLRRTLLSFDLWTGEHAHIDTSRPNPDCEVCAHRRFTHLTGAGRPHITLCGRNSVQIHEHHRPVDLLQLRDRLAPHPDLQDLRANDLLLRFRRGPHTLTLFADGRAIIQGTTDIALARSLYTRFIGS